MNIETTGSFLPDENLIAARQSFEHGDIDRQILTEKEDTAIRLIAERQISCGLPFVTSGELRRKHWAKDFWFGLQGISCNHIDSGHIYQPVETAEDVVHINGRIAFNPEHPFFDDFRFLKSVVSDKAKCRQTLPSPASLLLEIYDIADGHPESTYSSKEELIRDIAEAYRLTALKLYELGCDSLQYDDTALGLMCDDDYTKRLLQGGVDLLGLHREIIDIINASLEGLPTDMETSIYISGGDPIVPEWEHIDYPDNIMPKALSSLNFDKFFLPFALENDYAIEVLRHIPQGKMVVLGLADAHSPLPDDPVALSSMFHKAARIVKPSMLAISPRSGFKLSSFYERALSYEDQWRKLKELAEI
ncbi:MAG: hypothetical protein HDS00_05025 [Bacteroides sp.]|nr:hypothetical protein [Bacteroides sp.]